MNHPKITLKSKKDLFFLFVVGNIETIYLCNSSFVSSGRKSEREADWLKNSRRIADSHSIQYVSTVYES